MLDGRGNHWVPKGPSSPHRRSKYDNRSKVKDEKKKRAWRMRQREEGEGEQMLQLQMLPAVEVEVVVFVFVSAADSFVSHESDRGLLL